jgi:riboflavin-specific deaminase-like protein
VERPEIIINVASSLDGVIASDKGALFLSTTEDWVRVHELRNSVGAILVGVNTIIIDNPMLTIRYVKPKSPPPLRVILDSKGRIPLSSNVLQNQKTNKTLVFISEKCSEEKKEEISKSKADVIAVLEDETSGFLDLKSVLEILKTRYKINKVLVEGGSTIITQFLKNKFIDRMYIFYFPAFAGGINAKHLFSEKVIEDISDALQLKIASIEELEEGFLVSLKLDKR